LRKDRALVVALVFSAAVHLGVLVDWKGAPEDRDRLAPKHMVARLMRGTGGLEGSQAEGETPERETPGGTATDLPSLRSVRVGAAGGKLLPSGPVSIRPAGKEPGGAGKAGMRGSASGGTRFSVRAAISLPPSQGRDTSTRPADPLAEIRRLIETHKSYPGLARRKGWEGDVVVELRLDGGGAVSDVKVVEKSGYGVLDRATVSAVQRAGPYPPLPGKVQVPISYRLVPE